MRSIINTFWVPLLLGIATSGFSAAINAYYDDPPSWLVPATVVLTICLFAWAGWLAIRARAPTAGGGRGGKANAEGENSEAVGGGGGSRGSSVGGDGGDATARGRGSTARGGDGGHG